jgi:hypothetical protein
MQAITVFADHCLGGEEGTLVSGRLWECARDRADCVVITSSGFFLH